MSGTSQSFLENNKRPASADSDGMSIGLKRFVGRQAFFQQVDISPKKPGLRFIGHRRDWPL